MVWADVGGALIPAGLSRWLIMTWNLSTGWDIFCQVSVLHVLCKLGQVVEVGWCTSQTSSDWGKGTDGFWLVATQTSVDVIYLCLCRIVFLSTIHVKHCLLSNSSNAKLNKHNETVSDHSAEDLFLTKWNLNSQTICSCIRSFQCLIITESYSECPLVRNKYPLCADQCPNQPHLFLRSHMVSGKSQSVANTPWLLLLMSLMRKLRI